MVVFTQAEKKAIASAVREAEKRTSVDIVVVGAPMSESYASYVLLYGLCFGSIIASLLWIFDVTADFPLLLATQLGLMFLIAIVPALRRALIRLVPRHVQHHQAGRKAYREYLILTQHVSPPALAVLVYTSLAERYVHILPSPAVRKALPHEVWDDLVRHFTATVRQSGLQAACLDIVSRIGDTVAAPFPPGVGSHPVTRSVVECAEDRA